MAKANLRELPPAPEEHFGEERGFFRMPCYKTGPGPALQRAACCRGSRVSSALDQLCDLHCALQRAEPQLAHLFNLLMEIITFTFSSLQRLSEGVDVSKV